MKKNIKFAVAIMLLGGIVQANAFAQDTITTTATSANSSPMQMLANQQSPNTINTTTATNGVTPAAQSTTTTHTTTTQVITPASPTPSPAVTPAAIDCNYTISQPFSQISPNTIVQWANFAATKTFTYDFQNYDRQFGDLKNCFTTTGWESFNEAMKASNNLKVAQDEHLFVSAKVDGTSQLISQSNNETQPSWIVRVPLTVTYQNQDREVTQGMYVDLTIKTVYSVPAKLGINQIIASPKTEAPSATQAIAGQTTMTTTQPGTGTTQTTVSTQPAPTPATTVTTTTTAAQPATAGTQ